jgi:hypothetical protein
MPDNDLLPEQLTKGRMVRAEGYVWCHGHGDIHEDTLDPFMEGEPTCFNGEQGVTKAMVHRTVYYRARRGDWK